MTQIKNKIRCWNKNVGYSQFEIDKRKTRSVGEKNINSILNDRDIIMI